MVCYTSSQSPVCCAAKRSSEQGTDQLRSSGSYWKTEETQNLAIGYSLAEGSRKHNYDFLPMRGSPAGGGYSTVEDLFRFATSLLDNKLLNTEYTTLVTTGKVDVQETEKYAYGFFDQLDNGIRRYGHIGGAPGINSTLRIYPTSGAMWL